VEQTWLDRLQRDDIVFLDGGTGSELKRRGVEMSPAAWSGLASRNGRTALREIHADYVRAGADIITTNTFATTRFVLDAAGYGNEFDTINQAAVEAALQARKLAADRPVAIAGSMSCVPPNFDDDAYPSPDEEADAYHELAKLLVGHGVDLIALEMLQDAEHGCLAVEAAVATGVPVCLGVSARLTDSGLGCFDYPDRDFGAVVDRLLEPRVTAVNVMHTPCDDVSAALEAVKQHWHGPLGAYPELGDPARSQRQRMDGGLPAELADLAVGWVGCGARLLGGCCGMGPAHIEALVQARPRLLQARVGR